MSANLAERSSDGLITDDLTDELTQVESDSTVTALREAADAAGTQENRGVLNGLKVIGLA